MAKKNPTWKIKTNFNLGGEQAEADPLLQDAFYNSHDYLAVVDRTEPKCFMVARTGAGKSAILKRLEEEQSGHVVRITPDDLALPYVTDLQLVRYLTSLNVKLDQLFIALWKHVLLVELIKHRYSINSEVAKDNFFQNLLTKIKGDHAKKQALEYFNEFQGRFWCETDERVREIIDKFSTTVGSHVGASAGIGTAAKLGLSAFEDATQSSEVRSEQVERFQRLVNETQLARLNKMMKVLDEYVLDSPNHYTYVVIDDLDKDWVDDKVANDLIRCLFRAVLDLKPVRQLKIVVALRTNIFEKLDFAQMGAQEEKFRSLAFRLKWTRMDLLGLADERVKVASTRADIEATSVRDLLPPVNATRNAVDYILDRTLMRPRDLIAFLNEGLGAAFGKGRLTWEDIATAERAYSKNRLLALRDEWRSNYPDLDKVLMLFQHLEMPMDWDEFKRRLDDAMLLPADYKFAGVRWMTEVSYVMSSGTSDDWVELYQPIISLLYRIGFVGCGKTAGGPPVYFHDEPDFVDLRSNLLEVTHYFVHPAFHGALDIRPAPPSRKVRSR